jgi:hypothetical protein
MSKITYNINGTVRLYWNKENISQLGIYINENELPQNDPEINAIYSAMNQFNIEESLIDIYTFDLQSSGDIKIINDLINKSFESPQEYITFIKLDENNNYETVYISSKNPDIEYANFNIDSLSWNLPENYEIIKQINDLTKEKNIIIDKITEIEQNSLRSLEDIILSQILNNSINENDIEYFTNYMLQKTDLRNQLSNIEIQLLELSNS